jgi:hypothetical protein
MRMQTRYALVFVTSVALTAACDAGGETTVALRGDSIGVVKLQNFAGVGQSGECQFSVEAVASGSESDTVTLVQGRVVYTSETSGDTLITWPIDPAAAGGFWESNSNRLAGGASVKSKPQGISASVPIQPMRGVITFDYTAGDSTDTKTTEPFTFVCRDPATAQAASDTTGS